MRSTNHPPVFFLKTQLKVKMRRYLQDTPVPESVVVNTDVILCIPSESSCYCEKYLVEVEEKATEVQIIR